MSSSPSSPDTGQPERNSDNGRHTSHRADSGGGATAAVLSDRHSVVAREKDRYGGVKWGAAFFGWLTATGTAVILTAVLVAAGAVVGLSTDAGAGDNAADNAGTIGVAGAIVLLAVLLVAYYAGGYVAGRMARFNGVRQGVAVWVWAVVIAIVVAILAAVAGTKFDILDKVGGFPRLPIGGGDVTTGGIIAGVIAVVAALAGAILGGLAGMRFHRNVDKAGLGR